MSWIWGATPHAELSVESNRAHASDEAIARSLAADEDEQLAKSLQVSSATEAGARHAAEARVTRARNAEIKAKMEQQRDCKFMARDNAKDVFDQVRRDIAREHATEESNGLFR